MAKSEVLLTILEELTYDADQVEQSEISQFEKLILEAKRIFVAGAGRSGFVARAFSNRMVHLGFSIFFVGEVTTPAIQEGDLLIIVSGSGKTSGLVAMANKAKSLNVKLGTLTIFPENPIGQLADVAIKLPGVSFRVETKEKRESIQPEGSSFEQLSWLVFDNMIVDLIKATGQTQEQMNGRHANLE